VGGLSITGVDAARAWAALAARRAEPAAAVLAAAALAGLAAAGLADFAGAALAATFGAGAEPTVGTIDPGTITPDAAVKGALVGAVALVSPLPLPIIITAANPTAPKAPRAPRAPRTENSGRLLLGAGVGTRGTTAGGARLVTCSVLADAAGAVELPALVETAGNAEFALGQA
jgi:hypothetical protein